LKAFSEVRKIYHNLGPDKLFTHFESRKYFHYAVSWQYCETNNRRFYSRNYVLYL